MCGSEYVTGGGARLGSPSLDNTILVLAGERRAATLTPVA